MSETERRPGPASVGAYAGLIGLAITVALTILSYAGSTAVLFYRVGDLEQETADTFKGLQQSIAALAASNNNNERLIRAETNVENLMQEVRRLRWTSRGYTPPTTEAPKPRQ